jgi:alpha-L-fucosidase
MLNVPLRGDGSIDDKARVTVDGIAEWMAINSEAIYGTRPWHTFGEGPAIAGAAPISAQGFNEGRGKPFTAEDVRFTTKGKVLYAVLMGWPDSKLVTVKTLGAGQNKVSNVSLLGAVGRLVFTQTSEGLKVTLPEQAPGKIAHVLKIEGAIG